MIKKLFNALYADGNIFYFNEDYDNARSNCNGMVVLNIDLNNINLDDTHSEEDNTDTIILMY